MRALVVGLGGIGRRHARTLREIDPQIVVTGCRLQTRSAVELGADAQLFDRIDYDLATAIGSHPDVAIVSTPASLHVPIALQLVRAGVHVLVEKPLAAALDDVDVLIEESRRRSRVLMVGYNLRFDRGLQAVKAAVAQNAIGPVRCVRAEVGQFLPDWRPDRDHRATCSAQAALGGGVLFELSHEIDYVRWIAGEVRAVTARVQTSPDLGTDVPAVADLILSFDEGVVGNVHLDMIDRAPVRRCRVLGRDGTLAWDGITGEASLYSSSTRTWTTLVAAGSEPRSTTYLRELQEFLASVAESRPPSIDGMEGAKTLRAVLAAAQAAETGREVTL